MDWKYFNFKDRRYKVSSNGDIVSLSSNTMLKQRIDTDGYPIVTLGNKGRTSRRVHRLVAENFIDNPNMYKEVNHIDGVKTNNFVDNLEWCTRSENVQHAFDNGLKPKPKGEKNGRSKLCDSDILEIRCLLDNGFTRYEIANMYKVSWTAINFIYKGKTWCHV